MERLKLYLVAIILCIVVACSPKKSIATYYSYKTECLRSELDGTEVFKTWGTGENEGEATQLALKNALNDILFNGITDGKKDCSMNPIVAEPNARKKYEEYFNGFFTKGGYNNYISIDKSASIVNKQSSNKYTVGLVVTIMRSKLENKLKQDGIIR